jgi:hypothetical protein
MDRRWVCMVEKQGTCITIPCHRAGRSMLLLLLSDELSSPTIVDAWIHGPWMDGSSCAHLLHRAPTVSARAIVSTNHKGRRHMPAPRRRLVVVAAQPVADLAVSLLQLVRGAHFIWKLRLPSMFLYICRLHLSTFRLLLLI